jgi:hypothetical protein
MVFKTGTAKPADRMNLATGNCDARFDQFQRSKGRFLKASSFPRGNRR